MLRRQPLVSITTASTYLHKSFLHPLSKSSFARRYLSHPFADAVRISTKLPSSVASHSSSRRLFTTSTSTDAHRLPSSNDRRLFIGIIGAVTGLILVDAVLEKLHSQSYKEWREFPPGNANSVIAETLTTGDIVLFRRRVFGLDPFVTEESEDAAVRKIISNNPANPNEADIQYRTHSNNSFHLLRPLRALSVFISQLCYGEDVDHIGVIVRYPNFLHLQPKCTCITASDDVHCPIHDFLASNDEESNEEQPYDDGVYILEWNGSGVRCIPYEDRILHSSADTIHIRRFVSDSGVSISSLLPSSSSLHENSSSIQSIAADEQERLRIQRKHQKQAEYRLHEFIIQALKLAPSYGSSDLKTIYTPRDSQVSTPSLLHHSLNSILHTCREFAYSLRNGQNGGTVAEYIKTYAQLNNAQKERRVIERSLHELQSIFEGEIQTHANSKSASNKPSSSKEYQRLLNKAANLRQSLQRVLRTESSLRLALDRMNEKTPLNTLFTTSDSTQPTTSPTSDSTAKDLAFIESSLNPSAALAARVLQVLEIIPNSSISVEYPLPPFSLFLPQFYLDTFLFPTADQAVYEQAFAIKMTGKYLPFLLNK